MPGTPTFVRLRAVLVMLFCFSFAGRSVAQELLPSRTIRHSLHLEALGTGLSAASISYEYLSRDRFVLRAGVGYPVLNLVYKRQFTVPISVGYLSGTVLKNGRFEFGVGATLLGGIDRGHEPPVFWSGQVAIRFRDSWRHLYVRPALSILAGRGRSGWAYGPFPGLAVGYSFF